VPEEGVEEAERDLSGEVPYGRFVFWISDALWFLLGPLLEATAGRRPWIEASSEQPPVTMVWRATGRRPASETLDEIAGALARGESRPAPVGARWVGYDRGGLRLARKSA
jgi:hypothetical protein